MGVNPNTGQLEDRQAFILDEMAARVNQVKADGFDGVAFDNVDAWQNNTGLTITSDTQLQFDTQLANIAHNAGLTVALKNDTDQICAWTAMRSWWPTFPSTARYATFATTAAPLWPSRLTPARPWA